MDIEHLTKHQIVLLTLLVSFVTSIATGIVTVSLMNQAPPEVQRTINQIVERTVQTVATPVAAVPSVGVEKTVVVKEDDLTAQSIAKAQKAIIRIVDASAPETLLARGILVSAQGRALTDRTALVASGATSFEAILPGGERVPLAVPKEQSTTTATLVVEVAVGTTTGWAPIALTDVSKLQLGQSVIRIGGTGADTVGVGVIASLPLPAQAGDNHGALIEASVSSATPGSVLLTLFGEIVGVMTGGSQAAGADYYSVSSVSSVATSP